MITRGGHPWESGAQPATQRHANARHTDARYSRIQDLLLAGYVVLLPVQVNISPTINIAPSDVFLCLAMLGFALRIGRIRVVTSAWSIWHAGLVLSFLMSTLVALVRTGYVTRTALLNKDIGLLVLLAAYTVVVSQTDTWDRIRWILRTLILAVAVQNLICLVVFAAGRLVGFGLSGMVTDGGRLAGLLIDPNAYGGLLVLVLSIHIVNSCGSRPLVPGIVGGLVTLTLSVGTLLTYSRSAWIGLALVFLIAMLLRPRTGIRLVVACAIAFAAVLQVFGPQYFSQIAKLTLRQTQVEGRMQLIHQAFAMFWQSPAIGIGLGVYDENVGQIIHNTPIWILTECGLLGFCILAGLAIWFVRRGVQAYRLAPESQRSLVLGILTANIAMVGLSMGIEALYQRHWWLVLALIVSSHAAARKQRRFALSEGAQGAPPTSRHAVRRRRP